MKRFAFLLMILVCFFSINAHEKSSIKKLDPVIVIGKISLNDLEEMIINISIKDKPLCFLV